jgi:16S rRNA (adenine1518-N6/adenine1519-N6)-dimethyltransferase
MANRGRKKAPSRTKRPPLGQHFLNDIGQQQRILDRLRPAKDDCWLEIGPGHGELTSLLAPQVKQVVAVERDRKLAEELTATLKDHVNFSVVIADILKVSLAELAQQHNVERWRVYGSLPYYITSPILHLFFEAIEHIADVQIVIQKEVAERLAAEPGSRDYGYLSVATQYFTRPAIAFTIPRGAFRPPPKVESALVELIPRTDIPPESPKVFLKFVQTCFRHKRKTLANNLAGLYPPDALRTLLADLALEPRCRAEQLSLEKFAELFRRLPRAPVVAS